MTNPKIHIFLIERIQFQYVIDQVEFIFAIFKQNGFEVSCSDKLRDDRLNIIIEGFSNKRRVQDVANYCRKNNKKVSIIMTEHIDCTNNGIFLYSQPINDVSLEYNPAIKSRIESLFCLLPHIRYFFTLGPLPKLIGFDKLSGKTPIMLPFPKIRPIHNDSSLYDFVFTGASTDYRAKILDKIKSSYILNDASYKMQNIHSHKKRNEMVSPAKINLNVPQNTYWKYPSLLRIIFGLSLGKMSISLNTEDELLENMNFYATIKDFENNVASLDNYLENYNEYYTKFLENYNYCASKMSFPAEYLKIWGLLDRIV